MLKVNNLKFAYRKDEYILNDINFELNEGKIYVLLGKNGSGKTTLLKCLSGIYDVIAGLIDKKVDPVFIEDNPKLYYYLSGREYIELILTLNDGAYADLIKDLIKDLKMDDQLDKTIIDYSLGMKHKLALMSAILLDYQFYLIDEPLTALDPDSSRFMINYFKRMIENNKTLLISTHMMHIAYELADEILILINGRIKKVVNDFPEYNDFETFVISEINE